MDLRTDAPLLLAQLGRVVDTEPPPEHIRAIYFGLFEVAEREGSPTRPILYVSGSSRSRDEPDWACWEEDSWLPSGRYFQLPTLAQQDPTDWEAIEDAVANLLIEHRSEIDSLLGTDRCSLAVGWDEGEPRVIER